MNWHPQGMLVLQIGGLAYCLSVPAPCLFSFVCLLELKILLQTFLLVIKILLIFQQMPYSKLGQLGMSLFCQPKANSWKRTSFCQICQKCINASFNKILMALKTSKMVEQTCPVFTSSPTPASQGECQGRHTRMQQGKLARETETMRWHVGGSKPADNGIFIVGVRITKGLNKSQLHCHLSLSLTGGLHRHSRLRGSWRAHGQFLWFGELASFKAPTHSRAQAVQCGTILIRESQSESLLPWDSSHCWFLSLEPTDIPPCQQARFQPYIPCRAMVNLAPQCLHYPRQRLQNTGESLPPGPQEGQLAPQTQVYTPLPLLIPVFESCCSPDIWISYQECWSEFLITSAQSVHYCSKLNVLRTLL